MAQITDTADSDRASARATGRFDTNCKFCGDPIDWCEPSIAAMGAGSNIKTFPVNPGTVESHAATCTAQPNKHPKKVWTNPHFKKPDETELHRRLEVQTQAYQDEIYFLKAEKEEYLKKIASLREAIKNKPATDMMVPLKFLSDIKSNLDSIRARLRIDSKGGKIKTFKTIASTSIEAPAPTKKARGKRGHYENWKHPGDTHITKGGKIMRSPQLKAKILTAYAIGRPIKDIMSQYGFTCKTIINKFPGFKQAAKARKDLRLPRPKRTKISKTQFASGRKVGRPRRAIDIPALLAAKKAGMTVAQLCSTFKISTSMLFSNPAYREAFPPKKYITRR